MINNLKLVKGATDEYIETNGLVSIRVYKGNLTEGWRSLVSINGSDVFHAMILGKNDEAVRVKVYDKALDFIDRINNYSYKFLEE